MEHFQGCFPASSAPRHPRGQSARLCLLNSYYLLSLLLLLIIIINEMIILEVYLQYNTIHFIETRLQIQLA